MNRNKKLGEILVEGGLLTLKQLEQALPFQKKSSLKLGQFLVREGIVSEVRIVDLLSNQLKIEKYLPGKHIPDMELARIIPGEIAQKYALAPLQKNGMLLTVAMTDPLDINALDAIEGLTNLEVEAVICTEQQLNRLHTDLYGAGAGIGSVLEDLDDVQIDKQVEKTHGLEDVGVSSLPSNENGPQEDLMLDLETLLEGDEKKIPAGAVSGNEEPDLTVSGDTHPTEAGDLEVETEPVEGGGDQKEPKEETRAAVTDESIKNYNRKQISTSPQTISGAMTGAASVSDLIVSGGLFNFLNADSKTSDKVLFSAYYPHEVMSGKRYSIVFYAHIENALKEIEKDINKFVEELGGEIDEPKRSKLSAMIKEGTMITVVAECDELDFNPASASKRWESPFTRFLFDLSVPERLRDSTLFVRFSVQLLGIEIAQVKLAIEVVEKTEKKTGVKDYSSKQGGLYKKIFLSYSLKDREAVDAYRSVFQSISEDIFIDSNSLDRLGERNRVLPKVLQKSDLFYLFWSQNAASSPTVREDFETAIQHRCLGNYAAKPCRSFVRMVHWDQPLQPEPWPELKEFKPVFLPQLKSVYSGTPKTGSAATGPGAAQQPMNYLRNSFGPVSSEFQKALDYADTDPSGSLNKTRIVLEVMLLNSYRREMGKDPREKHIGVILCDNQFTRKIDRVTFFRIKTIRDLGNLGSHGEPVDAKDARHGLEDLFAVIDWHRRTYQTGVEVGTPPTPP